MLKKIKDRFYVLKHWYNLMTIYPSLSLAKVDYDSYWKDKRGESIGRLSDWQRDRADLTLKVLERFPMPVSIVDIGCGDGSILQYIRNHRAISEAIGVDISAFALKRAEGFGITPVLMDINRADELSRIPASDFVLMYEILEHIPHSEEFLAAAYQKSRRGVFFSFPNSGFFPFRARLLFGRFPMQWRMHPGEHLRYWTAQDLRWWLRSLGYARYTIFHYKGFPVLNKIWPALFAAGFLVHIEK